MSIEIHWDNGELETLEADLIGSSARVQKAVVSATRKGGQLVAQTARSLAPRRTGKLSRSISSAVKVGGGGASVDAEIGTTVRYGRFQEHGTSRMAAHPFLGPALDAKGGEAAQLIVDAAIAEVLP